MTKAAREPSQSQATPREQKVFDDRGGEYILGERLSKGGQGTIVRIKGNARQIVKLANTKASDPATARWAQQVARIRYLPVQDLGLPVVMPLAYINKPRPGYVMELMEGLVPLESLMVEFDEAMREGRELEGFVQSGGLGRRLALLARLARVLASLHGLGIAHGDLSPKNVFVSSTHGHAQVWLIDVDNLCYAVRNSSLQIARRIAHGMHDRIFDVHTVALQNLLKQPWRGFAASAAVFRPMRAEKHRIHLAAHRREQLVHLGVHRVEHRGAEQAAPHGRLIGGHRHMPARLIEPRNRLQRAGQRQPFLRRFHIIVPIHIDRAIAVEDDEFHTTPASWARRCAH